MQGVGGIMDMRNVIEAYSQSAAIVGEIIVWYLEGVQ